MEIKDIAAENESAAANDELETLQEEKEITEDESVPDAGAPDDGEESDELDDFETDDFETDDDFDTNPALPEEGKSEESDEAASDEETADNAEKSEPKTSKFKEKISGAKNRVVNGIKCLPWKRIGKISGITAAACAVIYLAGVLFYSSHFYFHTALGSFDCSNITQEKAEEKIRSELANYTFTIRERNDKTETISAKNIDYVCKSISGIDEAMNNQNPFKWFFDRDARIQKIDISADFDKDKLYHEAEKLDCFAESIKDMDGAYAGVYYEDGTYHMREVENKNAISFEKLYSALVAGFNGAYKDMSLEEEGVYVLMADEDNMRHAIEKMDKYVSTVVTYTRGSDTFELNGDTIQLWISINPDCSVEISDDGIAEYVSELSALYNTVGTDRAFTTSAGNAITVSGGDYGWEIDKAKEAEALKEDILNGEAISREPKTKHREISTSSSDSSITGTYVEVNIAAQTLWFYKNGELVVTSPVVTGNPFKGNATHTGVYSLKYKEKNAVLRGDNYETPVSFWMPFNGGEGLHDATWRGAFGGSIYRGGGSHGCVNLPYNVAATIFSNIDPGTPVVVF